MVSSICLLVTLMFAAISHASPIQESRHKRDLMIEMDEAAARDLLGGDFDGDSDLLNRKRRDLMIESDDEGDVGEWLLANRMRRVDELPIGKRSVSAFVGHQQQKKSNKKKPIYVWFPDDTKHIRRPTAHSSSRVQLKNRPQQTRYSDTFKFSN